MASADWSRVILHVDMDAFFASIEQVDHPEWRGKPVIVGAGPTQRGVVSTCSYEARVFGVHSAMPSQQAFERCPEGIFVTPRMARYHAVSAAVFAIFEQFTPEVEPLSVDEAFLEVTHALRFFGSATAIAQQLQAKIYETLGLTCSVGIAPNKFLAKLASEEKKPGGCFVVPEEPSCLLAWLGRKSVRQLWGVGPKLAAQLEAHRLFTVRDLQCCNQALLAQWTSARLAHHLIDLAFGRDCRPVETQREEKSFSREHTFPEDTTDCALLKQTLRWITEDIGQRLRAHGVWGRVGRLKIRYAGFRTVTRQKCFPTPVCDDQALREMAWWLLACHLESGIPVRLIGFGVEDFYDTPLADADLFASPHPRRKQEVLSHTLDRLRKRYKNAMPITGEDAPGGAVD